MQYVVVKATTTVKKYEYEFTTIKLNKTVMTYPTTSTLVGKLRCTKRLICIVTRILWETGFVRVGRTPVQMHARMHLKCDGNWLSKYNRVSYETSLTHLLENVVGLPTFRHMIVSPRGFCATTLKISFQRRSIGHPLRKIDDDDILASVIVEVASTNITT